MKISIQLGNKVRRPRLKSSAHLVSRDLKDSKLF